MQGVTTGHWRGALQRSRSGRLEALPSAAAALSTAGTQVAGPRNSPGLDALLLTSSAQIVIPLLRNNDNTHVDRY